MVQSEAWFDEQYNNRARVPESADILSRWTQASQLMREQPHCLLDLPYGQGEKERLDIFTCDAREPAPVLVFIHGGYWRALDKADHAFIAATFVDEAAMVVVPNYDLCPQVSMERIFMQMAEALAWVWRHIAEHGGDPNRIVLAGHSAGGHLAALLACFDWKTLGADLPRQLVKGVLSLSGLHDLGPIARTPFLQADLKLDSAAVRRLSPIQHPAPDAPVYALVGADESDEFKRQARLLREAWGARSVQVCEEIPRCNHFTILHDLVEPLGRSHQLARRLLDLRWHSALV